MIFTMVFWGIISGAEIKCLFSGRGRGGRDGGFRYVPSSLLSVDHFITKTKNGKTVDM